MADETDKAGDIAGNSELAKESSTNALPKGVDVSTAEHEKLMPVVAPVLLDAPEEVTKKTAVPPASGAKFKTVDALAKAVSSLYSGNAVVEATKTKTIESTEQKENTAVQSLPPLNPLERSNREMGLEAEPVREKTLPPEIKSLKQSVESEDGLPRVRTYANDISAEIRKRNTTLTSIVGAEQKRTMAEGPYEDEAAVRRRANRMRLFLGGAILFILIGIGSVGIAFFLNKPDDIAAPLRSLIPANHSITVEHSPEEPLPTTLAKVKDSAVLNLGEVESFVVTENSIPLSTADILTLLGAPDALVRNTTGTMVGIHAFDHNQPFLLISVAAYDHAFQAMLSWETRMDEGLGDFFKPSALAPASIASTPPPLTFTDRTVQNIDIRESQPAWHIMYAFLRPDLIIITTNESTLREVITRLSLQKSE